MHEERVWRGRRRWYKHGGQCRGRVGGRGVWQVAAVESKEWHVVRGVFKENGQAAERPRAACVGGNRFSGLEVSETIDEEKGFEDEDLQSEWPKVQMSAKVGKKLKKRYCDDFGGGKDKVKEVACCAVGCPSGLGSSWKRLGRMEITVDSAAEESVCPKEWCKEYGTKEPDKWLKFVSASGGMMNHYGERSARFKVEGQGNAEAIMALKFQVSDVQKPLAAVRRIVE